MATKKAAEAEIETEVQEEEEQGERLVKIILPYNDEEGDQFVSVNARTWLIQRGVEVEVPECVYEVLKARDSAVRKAHDAAAQFLNG